jgi:hypothetical protein
MPSLTLLFDTGAGTLSAQSKTFNAAIRDRLRNAVIAELQQQGIPSPTNQQIVDYLMARAVADWKTFARGKEAVEPTILDI